MRRLLLVLLVAVGCGSVTLQPSAPSPLLDQPLPDLAGETVIGPAAELANRVVVVKFFAKYCEPCKKTLPEAEKLHRSHPDVTFVGVAEDEERADVDEMIATYGLTFPVIHDAGNAVALRFGVEQLPATFVTGANGQVKWVGAPGHPDDALEAAILWVKGSLK